MANVNKPPFESYWNLRTRCRKMLRFPCFLKQEWRRFMKCWYITIMMNASVLSSCMLYSENTLRYADQGIYVIIQYFTILQQ